MVISILVFALLFDFDPPVSALSLCRFLDDAFDLSGGSETTNISISNGLF